MHHLGNHVAADALHRGRQALGFENLLTLAVHHAALVVGHVVVFQQVLTDVEVAGFHLALGVLDGARHPAVLDGFAVLETQGAHHVAHPVGGENTHQVVFKRKVEAT